MTTALGSTAITKMYLGGTQLTAVYLGVNSLLVSSFSPQSVVFESDNHITRSALTGATNSKTASYSFWFQPTTDTTSFRYIRSDSGSRALIMLDASKKLRVSVSDGTNTFSFITTSTFLPTDAESHIAIAYDTSGGAGAKVGVIMRNGVLDVVTLSDTAATFTPTLNLAPYIGAGASNASPSPMVLREFMYWPGVFIDWSANIGKVFAAGAPVDVGTNGELVTGTTPAIYLSLRGDSAASTFLTNKGTGGDFTQRAGTPTIRADSPLIAYGDSLTYGTGASSYPTTTWQWLVDRGLNTPRRRANFGVAGDITSAILSKFTAALSANVAAYPKAIYSLEGGYNSIANGASVIVSDMAAMRTALLAAEPNAKYIFIGIPNGNLIAGEETVGARRLVIDSANSQLSTIYGAHFLDLLPWLITNGLAAAGLTPTVDDTADIAAGIVPRSLRMADLSVHLNDYGQLAESIAIKALLQTLGYD